MIVKLSTFFRSSLSLDPSADVTLAQEIELQSLYLDIERVRFPGGSGSDRRAGRPRTARLPPLILQPVVENAIKHGVAPTTEPVDLSIIAREEDAVASPSRSERPASRRSAPRGGDAHEGTGVGLGNVCERSLAGSAIAARMRVGPIPDGG